MTNLSIETESKNLENLLQLDSALLISAEFLKIRLIFYMYFSFFYFY